MALPAVIPMFVGAFATATSFLVGRVLIALGVSVLVFSGANILMGVAVDHLNATWSAIEGLPALSKGLQALGLLKVDVCLQIIMSAYAGRMTLMGISAGGSITRMVSRFG